MNEKTITPIGGYFELELPHFPEIHSEVSIQPLFWRFEQ